MTKNTCRSTLDVQTDGTVFAAAVTVHCLVAPSYLRWIINCHADFGTLTFSHTFVLYRCLFVCCWCCLYKIPSPFIRPTAVVDDDDDLPSQFYLLLIFYCTVHTPTDFGLLFVGSVSTSLPTQAPRPRPPLTTNKIQQQTTVSSPPLYRLYLHFFFDFVFSSSPSSTTTTTTTSRSSRCAVLHYRAH